jgi:hypothetical protein
MERKKQWWPDVESLYKARLNHFLSVANRHIYNRDYSIDAVHDALAKSVEYLSKHPERKMREQIVDFQIIKACKRINKYSYEIPVEDISIFEESAYDWSNR